MTAPAARRCDVERAGAGLGGDVAGEVRRARSDRQRARAGLNHSAGLGRRSELSTPPPSMGPEMVVVPAPLKVRSLTIVCSGPLTVNGFPLATFHDCGPPMKTGVEKLRSVGAS